MFMRVAATLGQNNAFEVAIWAELGRLILSIPKELEIKVIRFRIEIISVFSKDLSFGNGLHNAMLSATYVLDVPSNRFCDERHSAPYAQGKFVHAPGHMNDQEKKTTRSGFCMAHGRLKRHFLTIPARFCEMLFV